MAPFRYPDDSDQLDFELLKETSVSLYFSQEVLGEHVAWLREHRYLVHEFDCVGWTSEMDFHREASRVLGFPAYYGCNLAAFKDCLCAIDIPEVGGTALAFSSFDAFFTKSPEPAWAVLDIIAIWSRYFLLQGRRLLALVHSDDRGIRLKPVGARPVLWNGTEGRRHMREMWDAARKKSREVRPPSR